MRATRTFAENGPGAADAHVWYARPEDFCEPKCVAALEALLAPNERATRARLRFPEDRHLYLVAHALLRASLAGYLQTNPAALRFGAGPQGKPVLEAPPSSPLHFNLSHTRGLVAWVVSRECAAGIDVEERSQAHDLQQVAAQCLAPSELADLRSRSGTDHRDRVLTYWTLKEAYLKARGIGLALPLEKFALTITGETSATIAFDPSISDDPSAWQFVRLTLTETHATAVALASKRPVRVVVGRICETPSSCR